MRDNPLPAVMGRACFHPCQTACNRAAVDETVGINAMERFLGDRALSEGWSPDPAGPATGKRVLVVGSGPGGLSAAYHLRLLGHEVVVYESSPLPGGMMRYGIPSYRLPRDVVEGEIERIRSMGVEIVCGRTVDDLEATMRDEGFDAAFLAVGAQRGKHADIPAGDSARILDAVTLLHDTEESEPPVLGRRVVDLRRRRHRHGRRPHGPTARRRRRRRRLPADPGAHAGQRRGGAGRRRRGRAPQVAVDHRRHRGRSPHHRTDGARRRRLSPAHRRDRGAAGGLGDPGARAGGGPVAARWDARRSRWTTGSSRSGPT